MVEMEVEDKNDEMEATVSQVEKEINVEMPWPAYSRAFDFRPDLSSEKNLSFACKFCIGGKIIHANKSSAANLKKHLNAKHPYKLKDVEKAKAELAMTNKRHNEDILENPAKKRQQSLERWGSGTVAVTQKSLDAALLRYIIEDVQPLAVVDSPAFIDLIKLGKPSSIRIMCRQTLTTKLGQVYLDMKTALENKLAKIEVISATADLWSKAKRSYLGMTVHWINPENFKRESAALACRRIKGKHTYDILAEAMNSIFLEYHIQNKICCVTTDNGSNFVKAFK